MPGVQCKRSAKDAAWVQAIQRLLYIGLSWARLATSAREEVASMDLSL